jgi:hypothetical protein
MCAMIFEEGMLDENQPIVGIEGQEDLSVTKAVGICKTSLGHGSAYLSNRAEVE